jgi:hypothetical protein
MLNPIDQPGKSFFAASRRRALKVPKENLRSKPFRVRDDCQEDQSPSSWPSPQFAAGDRRHEVTGPKSTRFPGD